MNSKVRHLLATGAAGLVALLAHIGPSLDSPWREVAAGVVALGAAYGINKSVAEPAEDDEAI